MFPPTLSENSDSPEQTQLQPIVPGHLASVWESSDWGVGLAFFIFYYFCFWSIYVPSVRLNVLILKREEMRL